jgi:hypothetical protein
LGQASQPVANWVAEKGGASGDNPYLDAMGGTIAGVLADPRSYIPTGGISAEHPNELPLNVAQNRAAKTGLEAQDFQRLYKDPGAIFAGGNAPQAGTDIGTAKVNSGINLGITNDPASLTPENLAKIKSPIATGKAAIDNVTAKISAGVTPTPDEAAQALTGVNNILGKTKQGTPAFQQWTMVKGHINDALQNVAPAVRDANQNYSREMLGQTFAPMNAVNKSGTPSKLAMMAGKIPQVVGGAAGYVTGGWPGAIVGWNGGKWINSLAHSPYIAGLQTAAGAVANKAVDPILEGVQSGLSGPLLQAYLARYGQQQNGR